ncbi:MAG TPA: DUF2625 domain-containing protein [Pedobacter sp.]|uniref:DUF2625 domain-containing protein n=1 Tax=Pedobacter sp. TaxID=1411316 RepID=UPI002CD36EE9|nr:DUF2625 domain-containing protein [Pedobacter sp.]HMI05355.1 DUF2625 domain-containing protein [Pedobacter sp.]
MKSLFAGHWIIVILIILSNNYTYAQNKMQPLDKLINKEDSGWPIVLDWVKSAKNKAEILSVNTTKAKDALLQVQVTTRSPMGAIVYHSGGLLIDNGWIRILGSGNDKLSRSLPGWNKNKSKDYLLIADDAVGGFFILNGGGLGSDLGKVYYFSPDNLNYEPLDRSYSEFLDFCFNGDLDKFYDGLRWKDWKTEVSKLGGDEVFNFFPFLWTSEGQDINKCKRKAISIEEQYELNMDLRKQM